MEHEINAFDTELNSERLLSLINLYGDSDDITCLIGNSENEKQGLLMQCGFRYAGKRMVDTTILSVYTRFSDISQPYEAMDRFFDRRVRDYDLHMRDGNEGYEASFISLFREVPETACEIEALDLGCGTGAELQYLFDKFPEANVTCVDVSGLMLDRLLETYCEKRDRISIVRESYLTTSFEVDCFDLIVACSTLHHLLPADKLALYRNVKTWLKPEGWLLVQDYMASNDDMERDRREEYGRLIAEGIVEPGKLYHFDLPLTVSHERELLIDAGLVCTRVMREGENGVLIMAKKVPV